MNLKGQTDLFHLIFHSSIDLNTTNIVIEFLEWLLNEGIIEDYSYTCNNYNNVLEEVSIKFSDGIFIRMDRTDTDLVGKNA